MRDALDAQERFCANSWARLVGAVSHYCGDVHVAEELVQEALLRACRRWAEVSKLAAPEGWTYRVAINLANSSWRRRRAEHRARERHGIPETVAVPVDVENKLLVRAALQELSAEQRDAVILRFVLDLTYRTTSCSLSSSTAPTCDLQLGLALADLTPCRRELGGGGARLEAAVNAVLTTPSVDRLSVTPRSRAPAATLQPDSTRSTARRRNSVDAPASHAALLSRAACTIQLSASTEPGERRSSRASPAAKSHTHRPPDHRKEGRR